MKKFISYLLIAVLCLSCLAGCGKKEETKAEETKAVTETVQKEATPVKEETPVKQETPVKEETAAKEEAVETTAPPEEIPVEVAPAEEDNSAEEAKEALKAAKDYLFSMYKDKQGTATGDFQLVGLVSVNGNKYNVEWTSDVTEGVALNVDGKFVNVDIDEKAKNDINFTLTGTLKDDLGNVETVTLAYTVPGYKLNTWAEYVAAAVNDPVTVQGVVTGLIGKSIGNTYNCIYFQDNDGAYYAYGMEADPIAEGLKEGMTVEVSGIKDLYSGTHEIKSASYSIIDSNINKVEPADYTELYKAAESLSDASITEKQSLLVTVKGVEITGQEAASGYYKFKLADKESYIRISSSVCPIVPEKDAFIAAHTEHTGWIANATGIICLYDGAFYLTPITVDAFEYLALPTKTDAEMVAFEAENLLFDTVYSSETAITLPAAGSSYDAVAIAWTTDNETVAAITDGVLNIVIPETDTIVNLTATLTSGAESLVKEISFKVEAPADDMCEAEILEKAFALEDGKAINGKQVLRGAITEINSEYSEKYGNITVTIQVGDKTIQCYRLAGGQDLAVGDVITVTGAIKNYKGTIEFDAGCTYSKDMSVAEAKQLVVVDKAYELEDGKAMNGKQVLRGAITEINSEYSEKYGNITVTIQVGEKTIQCYRLAGGQDLAVGDVITVTGAIKNYKGTIEFDGGCTYVK